jgi:hypothetical protein
MLNIGNQIFDTQRGVYLQNILYYCLILVVCNLYNELHNMFLT